MSHNSSSASKKRRRTSSTILSTDEKVNTELTQKSLNVSAGGVFYERASSRRTRHRQVLQVHSDDAVPLKRKQRTSSFKKRKSDNSTSTASSDDGAAHGVDSTPKPQQRKRKVFEEDREDLDKQLEWKAFKRESLLREKNPHLSHRFRRSNSDSSSQAAKMPADVPFGVRKAELLKKQQSIRNARNNEMKKRKNDEQSTHIIANQGSTSKAKTFREEGARLKVSPAAKKKPKLASIRSIIARSSSCPPISQQQQQQYRSQPTIKNRQHQQQG